jgi:beta-N-acetylhexosaminidase
MDLPEIEVLVGQMIVMDLRGLVIAPEIEDMLRKGWLGGVLLFPGPEATPLEVRDLTDRVRELSREYPPILAIDQEGGRVTRLKNGFTQFPAMRRLGAKNDEGLAFEVGKVLGKEMRAVGINSDLAPVVDLDLNPNNEAIGDRALSAAPETVAKLGIAIMRGLQSEKIAACAKHFPGHGASREDSHLELPTVDLDQATTRSRELIPFRKAIAAGVETVMVGHIKYPAFDKYHPATLSERIIGELLRDELNFNGVVIVDSLEMKALEGIPLEDRAFMAVKAGADLMLIAEGIESAQRIHTALCAAVKMGVLGADKVYLSFERILKLKENLLKSSDLPAKASLAQMVGTPGHKKIAASF